MWGQLTQTMRPKVKFDTLDINILMPTDVVNVPDDWLDDQSDLVPCILAKETD